MSITTTVTLDEDVFEGIQRLAAERGISFEDALNSTARIGCAQQAERPRFTVKPLDMGAYLPGVNYNKVSDLIAAEDGEAIRDCA